MASVLPKTTPTINGYDRLAREYAHAYRKAKRRVELVGKLYDCSGKQVLDLGCSGGLFSFGLAGSARHVTGIDGDANLIARNERLATEYGISNLSFRCATITPELVRGLDRYDAVLFLSVLHHIITDSRVYPWSSRKSGMEYGLEVLRAISEKTGVLFFEIGQSDEAHEWAPKLPPMGPAPDEWIARNLLEPSGFTEIRVISPPEFEGLGGRIRRYLHREVGNWFAESQALPIRAMRRVTHFDTRDCRFMFYCKGRSTALVTERQQPQ